MVKGQKTKATSRMGLPAWSVLLIIGSALTGVGVVFARRHGYENTVLWLGFVTLTLWFAALVCMGFKVLQIIERRRPQDTPSKRINTATEYVAEYSARDRWTALAIMIFFCVLLMHLLLRSDRVVGLVISGGFFCFFFWYTVHLMVTRVKFTCERIVARRPLLREISEPYTHVVRLRSKRGTMQVEFADGHKLKLHSGLGDPEVISAYLGAHCPRSVDSGGRS